MQGQTSKNIGMELLIRQYKRKFETEENINYYHYEDFVRAERKYIKYLLGNSGHAVPQIKPNSN